MYAHLPPLVCSEKIGMPEWALGWFSLGLGLVMEDEPSERSCTHADWLLIHIINTNLVPYGQIQAKVA